MKHVVWTVAVGAAGILGILGASGCSDDDTGGSTSSSSSSSSGGSGASGSSGSSGTSGSSGASGTLPTSLSAAYTNNCARCHGDTATGMGTTYPSLPGQLSESTFLLTVRAGKNGMPAFEASTISDADLKSDYAWMTQVRGK